MDSLFSIPQEILERPHLAPEFAWSEDDSNILAKFVVEHPELDPEEQSKQGLELVRSFEYIIDVPWISRNLWDSTLKLEACTEFFIKGNVTEWDLFLCGIIYRTSSLNRAFMQLDHTDNYMAALPFIRILMENCLSCYGGTLFDLPMDFAQYYKKHKRLIQMKDRRGRALCEKILYNDLNKFFPGFKSAYKKACEFVHLTQEQITASYKLDLEKSTLSLVKGFNGFYSESEKERYSRLMISANNVLLTLMTHWIKYKVELTKQILSPDKEKEFEKTKELANDLITAILDKEVDENLLKESQTRDFFFAKEP